MNLLNKRIVMARDIGIHGNLFGGTLMSWIDEAAAAYATEYCFTPNMVTVKVGELNFRKPLKAGQHVRIYGQVAKLGTTSITLNIEARKYSLYSGDETIVCTTSITFVRIDDDGSPTPIGESIRSKYAEITENTAQYETDILYLRVEYIRYFFTRCINPRWVLWRWSPSSA